LVWLGLGAASFDLLLAVTITSLLRTHVGHRLWRLVHWLAYLCWPAAVVHSLGTGTDTRQRWVLAVTACCVAAVVAAGAWRLAAGWQQRTGLRAAVAAGAAVALITGTAWLATGPLKPGWARRAGTPASLLAGSAGSAGSVGSAGPASSASSPGSSAGGGSAAANLPAIPFSASLSGHVSQNTDPGSGNAVVRIQTTVSPAGGGRAVLAIVITGRAAADGGVSMSASRVTFGPAASPASTAGN